jgi:hypothetical protein
LAVKVGIIKEVAVNIQSDFYAGMPQLILNVFDILPGGDSHADIGMPQGMEGNAS